MGRKYRQQGYQDGSEERPRGRKAQPRRVPRDGPRSPRMTAFKETFRCGLCGASLPPNFTDIEPDSVCPRCEGDLHSCKNCTFFDPGSRFECSQAIPKRISPKDVRNDCGYFEARTTVEKATTSSQQRPLDPRQAFENLFKK